MSLSESSKRQIRTLLLVIMSGVVVGILACLIFLYKYGPSGQYTVRNTLLSADLISNLTYKDKNRKTGSNSQYIFEEITFSFVDATKSRRSVSVPIERYREFYQKILSDQSLTHPKEEVASLFNSAMAMLQIHVRTENRADWQDETKVFQEVDFAQDFYRIQLHDEASENKWVYFYHPGINRIAINTLIKGEG